MGSNRILRAGLCVGAFLLVVSLSTYAYVKSQMVDLVHVYVDGEDIGNVENEQVVTQWLDEQLRSYEQQTEGAQVAWQQNVTFAKNTVFRGRTNHEAVRERLTDRMQPEASGTKVVVDGQVIGVVASQSAAKRVLDRIVGQYAPEFTGTGKEPGVTLASRSGQRVQKDEAALNETVRIQEDVDLAQVTIDPESLMSAKSLEEKLTVADEEIRIHNVQAGDTLSEIAKTYELTVDELLQLNPDVAEDDLLQLGQSLSVTVPDPLIHVETTEQTTKTETVPFERKVEKSDDMLKGKSKIKQKGKEGKKELTVEIIKVNGLKTEQRIVSEKMLEEPQTELVVKGTKVVPDRGTGQFQRPASGRLTSKYGPRGGRLHKGIDIAGSGHIRAADNGRVVFAGWRGSSYGRAVMIDHGNGFRTFYAHMRSVSVNVGQTVQRGQTIGVMGSTGNSTGVHLHFEMYKNGRLVNPLRHMSF